MEAYFIWHGSGLIGTELQKGPPGFPIPSHWSGGAFLPFPSLGLYLFERTRPYSR